MTQTEAIEQGITATREHKLRLTSLLYTTANEYGVPVDVLTGDSHRRALVEVRRVFVKEARRAGYSLSHIGRVLNRHHSSILHLART